MKKITLKYTALFALMLTAVLPITTQAQIDNEYYGRPSYWRPYDKRGVNVFETTKDADTIAFQGLRIRFGAGFTMQFQNLKHENTAVSNGGNTVATAGANKLYPISSGFMTSQANLFTDVQLADGISMNVTTYLSSRHHNEAWVKGGYIKIDKVPFLKSRVLDKIMEVATIKVGHMEINYGDAHFRRSDGGQTLYNPFMESYILDAFATEIGAEIYLQKNGLFGMIGASNGMIKGHVDSVAKSAVDDNTKRNPSLYLKAGIDKKVGDDIRVRLSGSFYTNSSSAGSGLTFYGGDRTGSNYQNVMEKWVTKVDGVNTAQASTAIAFSGRLNPGFSKKINAAMLNAFVKVKGLELFGTYETSSGRTKAETEDRDASQVAGDVIYRFGQGENFYVGARYNSAKAQLAGIANDVKVNRTAFAAGWFMTKNILMKGEYVIQKYNDFPTTDYRNGGKFNGYVLEAVVGF